MIGKCIKIVDGFRSNKLLHIDPAQNASCGLVGMIGKSERNQATVDLIKQHQSIYFIAVGGAAFLVSKAIKKSRVVAFEDLGMEAVYEFEVEDMPVTVAVDSLGQSVHQEGPKKFRVIN